MNKYLVPMFALLIIGLGMSVLALQAEESTPDATIKGHVYYCHDGDTCRIKVADAIWMNVRLAGIDAPEVSNSHKKTGAQPLGESARDKLNDIIKDKDVTIHQVDLDPYNRPVVEILLDGKNINLMMIELGFAEAYRGKTKRIDRKLYEDTETKAKSAKSGVWGLASYQSPKEFRDKGK